MSQLTTLFTDIADSLRAKEGSEGQIPAMNFPERIDGLAGKMQIVDESGEQYSVVNISEETNILPSNVSEIWEDTSLILSESTIMKEDQLKVGEDGYIYFSGYVVSPDGQTKKYVGSFSDHFAVFSDGSFCIEGDALSTYYRDVIKKNKNGKEIWSLSIGRYSSSREYDVTYFSTDLDDNVCVEYGTGTSWHCMKISSSGKKIFDVYTGVSNSSDNLSIRMSPIGRIYVIGSYDSNLKLLEELSSSGKTTIKTFENSLNPFLFFDKEGNIFVYPSYTDAKLYYLDPDGNEIATFILISPLDYIVEDNGAIYCRLSECYYTKPVCIMNKNGEMQPFFQTTNYCENIIIKNGNLITIDGEFNQSTQDAHLKKYAIDVNKEKIAYLQKNQEA